jgi:3-phenylpropionate/trans-cinnamate dioxygenase ferredoxin reductase component
MGVVVIGAGQAAVEFAIAMRAGGYPGTLTVVGDEPYLPYQRPPLSKDFLSGKSTEEKLFLRPENFWRGQKVEIRTDTAVAKIERAEKRVLLTRGQPLDYQTLVIATGTSARVPVVPGMNLPCVYPLRSIGDVKRLRPAIDAAKHVAIVGGGYIGLETAAVVRKEGREVTVIEAEERLLKRVTSKPVSEFYERLHRSHGVDIRLSWRLKSIEQGADNCLVWMTNGEAVAADLVLNATGAVPNEDLALASGIICENGIRVDEFQRTSDPDILAIGDCTRFPSKRFGRSIRLECVQNAFDQAKAAASNLLGKRESYDPVPWFWSDQYDVKFQSAGLSDGHDEMKVVGDPNAAHFSVEYRKGGKLIAVDAISDARAYMMGRKTITAETA